MVCKSLLNFTIIIVRDLGGFFMEVVRISNIAKRFNDKLVLDNVNYSVQEGEIFGFIGPNGAGKSTLINIMTGLLMPDNGSIQVCGHDVVKEPLKAKACIGYVPQDIALLEDLSAYSNLEYFGVLYGLRGKLLKERIDEALEVTGLFDKKKEKVKKFSGGMKRRLNLAVAIMHHPKLLILDEPTVGVDPQSRNHIFSFIKTIGEKWGTTVIYTSHYMEEIEELCERVFIIDEGNEIAYGNKKEIKDSVFADNKVIIECDEASEAVKEKLLKVVGINKLWQEENNLCINVDETFKLGNALLILEEEKVILKKITYEEPKLEDVFLALTGKNLRD